MILTWAVLTPLCVIGFAFTLYLIPAFAAQFMAAGIRGKDLNKRNQPEIPEAAGAIVGCVYLMLTFIMLPISFDSGEFASSASTVPHIDLVAMLSALLSIACMLLLGFADDVLDLKWRHKLLLPTLSCLPVLLVYYVTTNKTDVVLPFFMRHTPLFPSGIIDLGPLYYVYMGMLAVFATNAINIFSGVNGLEVGQSVLIALAVAIFNVVELHYAVDEAVADNHRFSLYFILPYIATTSALFYHNLYPASAFVGDTFCYFSGMTLAVVAILGHFSKTLLLFFVPQIANFVYSLPQLFRLIPCPRHRLPRLDDKSDGKLTYSVCEFNLSALHPMGRFIVDVMRRSRLVDAVDFNGDIVRINNLTLINLYLVHWGPCHERTLTRRLLCWQVVTLVAAFVVRYPLTRLIYDSGSV